MFIQMLLVVHGSQPSRCSPKPLLHNTVAGKNLIITFRRRIGELLGKVGSWKIGGPQFDMKRGGIDIISLHTDFDVRKIVKIIFLTHRRRKSVF